MNFTATVQRILNYSAFDEDVYNWFILVEEHVFSYFKISLLLQLQINVCSEKQVGINSVNTKDYTYCNFETTRSDLTNNKKGFFWFWLL